MRKSLIGMLTALTLATCTASAPVMAEEVCATPIDTILASAAEQKLSVVEIRGAGSLKAVLDYINSTGSPGAFEFEKDTVRLVLVLHVLDTPSGGVGIFFEVNTKDCVTFSTPAPTEMLKKIREAAFGRNV